MFYPWVCFGGKAWGRPVIGGNVLAVIIEKCCRFSMSLDENHEFECALWPFEEFPERRSFEHHQSRPEPQRCPAKVTGRSFTYSCSKFGSFIMKSVSLKSNLCFCVVLILISNWIIHSSFICSVLLRCESFPSFLNNSSVLCKYLVYYSTGSSNTNPNLPQLCGRLYSTPPLCLPFVCPCWASIYKAEHSFRPSGSSGSLIIHDLSMWIMAHSPTAISGLICSANLSKCFCCLSQQ